MIPNLPVYTQWPKIPEGLCTKTQLQAQRLLLPEDAQPIAYKKSVAPIRLHPLYAREDALPMPPKRVIQPRDYASQFARRYASVRSAYVDACTALFELNRYCKHSRCTQKHREAVYSLKHRWIARLYQEGFCTEAIHLRTPEREKECWQCEGFGCERCDGTGIYATVGGKEYWAFRFVVDNQSFAWHQPAPLSFVVEVMGEPQERDVLVEEKPVMLKASKYAEAKALIAWCLEQEGKSDE